MPTVQSKISINASAEQVWDAVRDVGAFHVRLVPGYTENTLLDGDKRTLILPNGGTVHELIVSVDDQERRMVFAVKEGRMPLLHHNASFQVFPDNEDGSTLVWITDFLPKELTEEIKAQANLVLGVIKNTIEAQSKTQ
ncbi:SRPBCC family protein [Paenibacillus sp. sgz500958]|uniref:SRPBCC family protein n=1 Tax=Paenibacillus sp. sgz500958 TaxID=3242475 RepID=UPI0036D2B552